MKLLAALAAVAALASPADYVLGKQRDPILHYFARDGPANRQLARVCLELVIASAYGDGRQVRIFGAVSFGQEGDDAVRRSRSKNNVGRFFEDSV